MLCLNMKKLVFKHRSHPSENTIFKKIILFVQSLAVLRLCCCAGFSPVAASRGYSLAAWHSPLITVASLVAEHVVRELQ